MYGTINIIGPKFWMQYIVSYIQQLIAFNFFAHVFGWKLCIRLEAIAQILFDLFGNVRHRRYSPSAPHEPPVERRHEAPHLVLRREEAAVRCTALGSERDRPPWRSGHFGLSSSSNIPMCSRSGNTFLIVDEVCFCTFPFVSPSMLDLGCVDKRHIEATRP